MIALGPSSAPFTSPQPRRIRRRGWTLFIAALGALGGIAVNAGVIGLVVAVFVVVVPFEKLFPRHRQRLRRPGVGTDLAYALASPLLNASGLVAGLAVAAATVLVWLPAVLLRPAVAALPPLARNVVAFLLFDLAAYWTHRLAHEVPLLWRFHRVHHSTSQLDWVSGFRGHPLDGVLLAPAFAVLVAAGFSPKATGVLFVVQVAVALFLHANVRWRLRPLQRIIATPEFHHWHHANEAHVHNGNYSGLLPVWDLLFRTYKIPADRRPARYGIDEPLPSGLAGQLVSPFRRQAR
jgi:sterol desaturase/sphingolipid hydroxylase (fatty acid hydroxylase superfamily)